MSKLRVGIIGTGGIAHAHMKSYMGFSDVEVVAGSDIIPGKAAGFFAEFDSDARSFEDTKEMLDTMELDAVSVCTYNTTHAECTIMALEKGLHVLCEKPMSVTLEQGIEMVKAQKKSGKILTIGFQPRYDANMQLVREIVQSGELGDVYYIQTGGGRRRGIPWGTFVQKDLAGMGALGDIGCYSIDMALHAINYPKPLTVSATASGHFGNNPKYQIPGANFDVDDFSTALVRLEGDVTLVFSTSWAMHMDTRGDALFLGTKAGLKVKSPNPDQPWGGAWDGTVGEISIFTDTLGHLTETVIPQKPSTPNRFEKKCRAFLDAIKTGGTAPIPADEILYNQAIVDGILRSSQSGHEVEIVIPEM